MSSVAAALFNPHLVELCGGMEHERILATSVYKSAETGTDVKQSAKVSPSRRTSMAKLSFSSSVVAAIRQSVGITLAHEIRNSLNGIRLSI
jgi:nitrogen-specific signal transduction histidine kinase